MRDPAVEVGTNSSATYFCRPLHKSQQETIYNNSVSIQDVALKTNRERWMIDTGGGRGSGRSVLAGRPDDDVDVDDDICK